jgi:hypothetical protein
MISGEKVKEIRLINQIFILLGLVLGLGFFSRANTLNLMNGDTFPIIFLSLIFGAGVYGLLKCFHIFLSASRKNGEVVSTNVSPRSEPSRSYSRGYGYQFKIGEKIYSTPKYFFTGAKHTIGSKVKIYIMNKRKKTAISEAGFKKTIIASLISFAVPLINLLKA